MKTGKIHAASLNSKRLGRFLHALFDAEGPLTTREVNRRAHTVAANSCASEARARGIAVTVTRKGGLWYYTLG